MSISKLNGVCCVAALLLTVCVCGCKPKATSTTGDIEQNTDTATVAVQADTALYGHLGESTGMSSFELITDHRDTLELSKCDEKTEVCGEIRGEIRNYTDRYAVLVNADTTAIVEAVNVTQLMGKWQQHAYGAKYIALTDAEQAEKTWSLCNCRLVIKADTFSIVMLNSDSLGLVQSTSPDTVLYYRQ